MRRLRLVLLGVLVAAAVLPSTAAAQRRSAPARIWVGAGIGAASALSPDPRSGSDEIGAWMGQLVFQKGAHYAALRAAIMGDPFGEGGRDTYGEAGALYGRTFAPRYMHATLAAGLAVTAVDPCGNGPSCTGLGVPVIAELALQPVPVVGVGVQGFANFNRHRSYGGIVAFVQFGWMP